MARSHKDTSRLQVLAQVAIELANILRKSLVLNVRALTKVGNGQVSLNGILLGKLRGCLRHEKNKEKLACEECQSMLACAGNPKNKGASGSKLASLISSTGKSSHQRAALRDCCGGLDRVRNVPILVAVDT